MSRFTSVSAAASGLVSSAGEPPAARTLIDMNDGGSGCCAYGMYIVGGTGSRSDRYTASFDVPDDLPVDRRAAAEAGLPHARAHRVLAVRELPRERLVDDRDGGAIRRIGVR